MRAFAMAWEEKERGWGNRPDGWSLHSSREEYESFRERHWAGVPSPRPDEYSLPVPNAALRELELSGDHPLARRLTAEKSIRIAHHDTDRAELEKLLGKAWPGA
jgi:hypothetical protein